MSRTTSPSLFSSHLHTIYRVLVLLSLYKVLLESLSYDQFLLSNTLQKPPEAPTSV